MSMSYEDLTEAFEAARKSDADLRAFACECCEELFDTFDDPLLRRAVQTCRRRLRGVATDSEVDSLKRDLQMRYEQLYPGYDDASPPALAICAASELTCKTDSLKAAVGVSDFVAQAISKSTAESGAVADFDRVLESVYDQVLTSHLKKLRSYNYLL